MEQHQLDELREILVVRKNDLQTIISGNEQVLKEQLSPESGNESQLDTNHPADMISGDPDYDKEIALIKRERAELALVNAALARISQDRFGYCDECEMEIPFARLKAIPFTKYCIECKEDKDAEAKLRVGAGAPQTNPHDVSQLGL